MKVTFLNDDCTRAAVRKGWFRKREATVERGARTDDCEWDEGGWRFILNQKWVGSWKSIVLECERDQVLNPNKHANPWIPVAKLPKARLIP